MEGAMGSETDKVTTFKIYVGNVPPEVEEDEIRKIFEEFGNVVSCVLQAGRAFVHMEDDIEARFALGELQGRTVNGAVLNIQVANSHSLPRIATVKLLVKNISPTVDARGLRNMFKRFGYVVEAQVANGEGHVCLEAIADVRSALDEMNGFKIDDMELAVEPGPVSEPEPETNQESADESSSPRKNQASKQNKGYNNSWNSSWSRAKQDFYASANQSKNYGYEPDHWNAPSRSPWGNPQPERILRDPHAHPRRGGRGGFGGMPPRGNMSGPRMNFPMLVPQPPYSGPLMGADRVMRSGPPYRKPPQRMSNPHFGGAEMDSYGEPSYSGHRNPYQQDSYEEEVFYEDEPISAFSRSKNQSGMGGSGANSIRVGGGPSWQQFPNGNSRGRGGGLRGGGGNRGVGRMGRGKLPKFTALNSEVSPGERYPVPPVENPGFRAPIKRSKDEGPIKKKIKKKKKVLVPAELPDYSVPVPELPKPSVPKGAVLKPFPPPQGQSVIDSDTFGGGDSTSFFEKKNIEAGQQMDFTTDDVV